MNTQNLRSGGFTLVEIMIVVAIIGLLAAIAIPNFVKSRATAQKNACINNLRQIDSAKQQWALETGQPTNAPVAKSTDIALYFRSGNITNVICPAGGSAATFDSSYSIELLSSAPTCLVGGKGGTDGNLNHILN